MLKSLGTSLSSLSTSSVLDRDMLRFHILCTSPFCISCVHIGISFRSFSQALLFPTNADQKLENVINIPMMSAVHSVLDVRSRSCVKGSVPSLCTGQSPRAAVALTSLSVSTIAIESDNRYLSRRLHACAFCFGEHFQMVSHSSKDCQAPQLLL